MATLERVLGQADAFLEPAFEPDDSTTSQSIVERLAGSTIASGDHTKELQTKIVIQDAILHLKYTHEAAVADKVPSDPGDIYEPEIRRVVYGLLDLIISQGVLPSLSPGVALPDRPKSVFTDSNGTELPRDTKRRNLSLLSEITIVLVDLVHQKRPGIGELVGERVMPDVFCAVTELAFCPEAAEELQTRHQKDFQILINNTPSSRLLPILTYLLHHDAPQWFRAPISKSLSLMPLRVNGVRQTIDLIASAHPSALPDSQDGRKTQKEPMISQEAIAQATKLLSTVPSSLTPEAYFQELAPQLWELLDGKYGEELSKVAGHVIGSGILGRRSIGSPGKIGWTIFAQSLHQWINPAIVSSPQGGVSPGPTTKVATSLADTVIVAEVDLAVSLARLLRIVQARSNPGLTKRLVAPLLLPLWGLLNYAESRAADTSKRAQRVLGIYFRLCSGPEELEKLTTNLFWDGPTHWTFAPGHEGGVEIRRRQHESPHPADDFEQIHLMDSRIANLAYFLSEDVLDPDSIITFFLSVAKKWLTADIETEADPDSLELTKTMDPMEALTSAKIMHVIISDMLPVVAQKPARVIDMVQQLLSSFVKSDKSAKQREENAKKPSAKSLSSIIPEKDYFPAESATVPHVGSQEHISMVLSVLTVILSAPNFRPTGSIVGSLKSIQASLRYVSSSKSSAVDGSIMAAENLASLISTIIHDDNMDEAQHRRLTVDRMKLNKAMDHLTAHAPPVRGEALYTLRDLIRRPSPVVDVPSLTLALLRTSISDPEEFVYLSAIQTLVALVHRDPHLAGRFIIDAFVDSNEDQGLNLDGRLRVGEALDNIVEELSQQQSLAGSRHLIGLIAEGTITVAGRRGQRYKAQEGRRKAALLERRRHREAEEAWGGDVPSLAEISSMTNGTAQEQDVTVDDEAIRRVIEGWEATGLDEDVRLRASALSVLASLLEKTHGDVGPPVVNAATELSLSVLSLEPEPEKGILRRAAALVPMALLRSLNATSDKGDNAAGINWGRVKDIMGWTADDDQDEIVRGHAREVLEAMDTRNANLLLQAAGDTSRIRFGLEGKIHGLKVDPNAKTGSKTLVEEIE